MLVVGGSSAAGTPAGAVKRRRARARASFDAPCWPPFRGSHASIAPRAYTAVDTVIEGASVFQPPLIDIGPVLCGEAPDAETVGKV